MTKDRLKEEIGLYKLLMTVAITMLASIVGCIWSNDQITVIKNVILFLSSLMLFFLVIFLFIKINLKIEELDKYE